MYSPIPIGRGMTGIGDAASIATSAGATAASIAAPFVVATAWIPVVGGIIAGAAIAITALTHRRNPNEKIRSSDAANVVETNLSGNLADWQAIPIKVKSVQTAAINIFYDWWNQLVQACSSQGNAGQKCINERKRGGTNSWGADWFQLYLDPILNDPTVVDDNDVVTVRNGDGSTTIMMKSQMSGNPNTDTASLINSLGVGGASGGTIAMLLGLGLLYMLTKGKGKN